MKLSDILKEKGREVITIAAEASLTEAAEKMTDRKIGALLVEDRGRLAGIITERDIVSIVSRTRGDIKSVKVKDVMVRSENLLVAEPDDQEDYVMAVMIQKGIRHMPIVENGEIAGMVSIRDVVRAHVKKLQAQVHFLTDYIK
jgi:CBS domain-containing protein